MQAALRFLCCVTLLFVGLSCATVFAQKPISTELEGAVAAATLSGNGTSHKAAEAASFPASARVMLPNKRQVHISKIRPGDEVLGYDAATGQVRATRVQRLNIRSDHTYQLVQLTIGTPAVYAGLASAAAPATPATKLLVTPALLLVDAAQQTRRADQLEPTNNLLRMGESGLETVHLSDRQPATVTWEVYNLRTETGNYFVNGVLVSSK